jgi:hypothetical protein
VLHGLPQVLRDNAQVRSLRDTLPHPPYAQASNKTDRPIHREHFAMIADGTIGEARSESVDRCETGIGRHPFHGYDHDLPAISENHLGDIVEQIVYLRVGKIVQLDVSAQIVDSARDAAFGFHEQRRDTAGHGAIGNLREIAAGEPFRARGTEDLDQSCQAREVVGFDDFPCASAEFLDRQGIRIDVDSGAYQKRVVTHAPKETLVLRQRGQQHGKGGRP